jgi:molecular chaperone DnaK
VIPAGTWVLAIDFGTTNTVAAVGDVAGVRPLNINGRTIMPSAVVLQGQRRGRQQWLVGDYAINAAQARMGSFQQWPKRCIADGTVLLGGRSVPVDDVVAAVLRRAVEEAHKQRGPHPPVRFVVTHPAGWGAGRIGVLLRAAQKATDGVSGWPAPEPLPEPVAAAQGLLGIGELESPARIAVLDLGGGTADVAVVDRDEAELKAVGIPQGTDQVGGEEFDLRLARLMTKEVESPRQYNDLLMSDAVDDRELALEIRTEARLVKEQLSADTPVAASVPVPPRGQGGRRSMQVSRTQLEELIKGGDNGPRGLVDAVRLVTAARAAAPPGPPTFHVYLVGGSSRIPMLGQLVQEETDTSPISHGDPSTAVAEGAAEWARSTYDGPPPNDNVPPPPPPQPFWARVRGLLRSRRQEIARAMIAALVAGSAIWAAVGGSGDKPVSCFPPMVVSSDGTTCVPRPPDDPPPSTPGVGTCTKAAENGCEEAIIAASRQVWPNITGRDCVAKESRYGVDLYSAECTTETMSYGVFWRKESGGIIPVLIEQMMRPELNEFRVGNDPQKLGTQLGGSRTTESGERFTCVFEYTDYPVTMILDGPNDDNTVTRCQTAAFLDSADMKSAMAER